MPKIIFRPNPTPPPFVPPTPVNHYLTFTAQEDGVKIGYIYFSEDYIVQDAHLNIEYSLDGGATWLPYTMALSKVNAQMIELDEGESVMFRGVNQNLAYYFENYDDYQYTKFLFEGNTAASGDVTSLLNAMGGDVNLLPYCFGYLFYECESLTLAPSLPTTNLSVGCYKFMFNGCTSLTQAPTLPATTLAELCYMFMFNDCTSLTQAPTLPATTLTVGCYKSMFSGCTSLTQAPTLPATTLADSCYESMFGDCTSLTQAPTLPATTLVSRCYAAMFYGCTSLNRIEALFLTTPTSTYTSSWVKNVAANGTFVKNSAATWNVSGVNGIPNGWTVETN